MALALARELESARELGLTLPGCPRRGRPLAGSMGSLRGEGAG